MSECGGGREVSKGAWISVAGKQERETSGPTRVRVSPLIRPRIRRQGGRSE